jgi:ribosomal protein S18 acetylase RimI-like enzyme
MAEFYVSVPEDVMARQVADMVNRHNRWYTRFSADSLLMAHGRYFVELLGNRVVACAGAVQEYPTLSKIMHICVLPEFRRQGLASKLANMAITNCNTEMVYMTVREDNGPSLAMAQKLGFSFVRKDWFKDHYTLTLGRRRDA